MRRIAKFIVSMVLASACSAQAAVNPSQERFDARMTAWQARPFVQAGGSIPAEWQTDYLKDDATELATAICNAARSSSGVFIGLSASWREPDPYENNPFVSCRYHSFVTGNTTNLSVAQLRRESVCPLNHGKVTNYRGDEFGDPVDGCVPPAVTPDKDRCENCRNGSNPIDQGSGNKIQKETDYVSSGPFPLRLERTYNSQGAFQSEQLLKEFPAKIRIGSVDHDYVIPVPRWQPRKLSAGRKWRHGYDRGIAFTKGGGKPTAIMVGRSDGSAQYFRKDGTVWTSDVDVEARVEADFNSEGEPLAWRYIDIDDTVEHFSGDGRLIRIVKRGGLTQHVEYHPDGFLARVRDDFGRALVYEYGTDRRIAAVVLPDGSRVRYTYDADGRLLHAQRPDGAARGYRYEDLIWTDALTSIVDETGVVFARFAYAPNGKAISSEHAGGTQKYTFSYPTSTSASLTDPSGRVQTYSHTVINGLPKVTGITGGPCGDCGSQAAAMTYDTNGRLLTSTDFNGIRTDFVHDARGLETSRTEAANRTSIRRTITTQWHPVWRVPVQRTEPGRITIWEYDALGNRSEETVTDIATGQSRTTRWTWSSTGLLQSVDGPRLDANDVTEYTYDAAANLIEVRNGLGHTTRITAHDAHGNPLTVIDPNGLVTTLVYDARQRLIERRVGGDLTQFAYAPTGLLERVTQPDGSFLAYTYDPAHRVVAVADNLGNRIDYTLDAFGNRVDEQVKDPGGVLARRVQRTYDNLNHLTALIGAAGTTTYTYDAEGQRLTSTDPLTRVTTQVYDGLRRLTTVTDPATGITRYAYDARDNLTQVTDPKGVITRYAYDGFDQVLRVESPDAGTTHYTYDAAGNRSTQLDARGITATYSYDALNRLTAIAYPDSALNVTYLWDSAPNGIGRLAASLDAAGRSDYAYDTHGNLLEHRRQQGAVTLTTRYAHDAADRLATLTYPSGARVDFARDAAGRVSAVTLLTPEGMQVPIATDIAWQAFGGLTGFTYGNGAPHARQYDLDGRVTAIDTAGSQALDYGYDAAGNLTALADLAAPAKSQGFGYDSLDRLTSATGAYGSQAFQYDAVGNRLSLTESATVTPYTYATTSNRLLTAGGRAYQYDAVGNTLADGRFTYTYDARNRLAEVFAGTERKATYAYDAQGQRVMKTVGTEGPDYAALAAEAEARAAAFLADVAAHSAAAAIQSEAAEVQEQLAASTLAAQGEALDTAEQAYAEEQAVREAAAAAFAVAEGEAAAADLVAATATAQAAEADAASIAATLAAISFMEQATALATQAAEEQAEAEALRADAAAWQTEANALEIEALEQRDLEAQQLDLAATQAALEVALRAEAATLLAEAEPELAKARAFRAKIQTPPKNQGHAVANANFEQQARMFEARVADLTDAAAEKLAAAGAAHAAQLAALAAAQAAADASIAATLEAVRLVEAAANALVSAANLETLAAQHAAEADELFDQAGAQEDIAVAQSAVREAALEVAAAQTLLAATIRSDASAAHAEALAEAAALHATGQDAEVQALSLAQQSLAATEAAIALRAEAAALTVQAQDAQLLADSAAAEAAELRDLADDPSTAFAVTQFAYDQQGHLIGEYNAEGALIREYLWLGDLPLAQLTPEGVNYIQADHLNTPVAMQDAAQQSTWTATREPFGETAVSGTEELPLRFPGQYLDAETGLHYNYFRDYDPSTGRYVESDPIGLAGGLNTFFYAKARPLTLVDAQGHAPFSPFALMYQCMKRVEKRFRGPQWKEVSDKRKHCEVAGTIAKECGNAAAYLASYGKEAKDAVGPGDADLEDLMADLDGIECANQPSECNSGFGERLSKCCMSKGW